MHDARLNAALARGLGKMGLTLAAERQQLLLDYLALLDKWNDSFNLTAVRDRQEMVVRHLLDSLSLLPFLDEEGGAVLDVGTGAGLPGIPLAVALPRRRFVLLDSNGKKTRFLFQVQLSLKLDNIRIIHERIEDYVPDADLSVIVSRAFSSLDHFIGATTPVWKSVGPDCVALAMKGEYPATELSALPPDWTAVRVEPVHLPDSGAQRHIVVLRRT